MLKGLEEVGDEGVVLGSALAAVALMVQKAIEELVIAVSGGVGGEEGVLMGGGAGAVREGFWIG